MNRVVTFSTNRTYQPYVHVLLHSLKRHYDGIIVCRCVNCDEEFIEDLKAQGVDVIIDNQPLNKTKRIKNVNESSVLIDGKYNRNCICTDETAYTCHSRFYNIDYIFKHYDDSTVFAIDCDFVILKSFDDVFDLNDADISILDHTRCHDEDAIVIRDTPQANKFLKHVINKLQKDLYFWDQDTLALRHAFKSTQLKIKSLQLKYKDYNCNDESVIWSGDGSVKYTDKFKQAYDQFKN